MFEEKAKLLEEKLPYKAVEEFRASSEFSVAIERLLSDKILKQFENLSTQN